MLTKMDLLWSKIAKNYIILPLTSDPRVWLTITSSFQCAGYVYMASRQQPEDRDAYEVLSVLQFFPAMIDLMTLILVLIKSPSLSTLYSNKKAVYVPVPLSAASKWISIVPILLDVVKLAAFAVFTTVMLLSGDVSLVNYIVTIILSSLYLIISIFGGLVMSWERFINFDDWFALDDRPDASFHTFSSPLSLSQVPTFTIPTATLSSYFSRGGSQAGLGENNNGSSSNRHVNGGDDDDNSHHNNENDGLLSTPRDRILSDSYDINLDPIKHSPLLLSSDDEDGMVMHIDFGSIAAQPVVEASSSTTSSGTDVTYSPPTISAGNPALCSDDELP